ncbi:hypothetical protein J6O57_12080 [Escherichia coli]|jgi:hypothetical protein|uniref:hypothetical protein n=1 Tax=Enterobacteriaceae TaxID=543 RepID=UPI0015E96859|nr:MULTISPECIES: hypothetical protein [Enterobacteriaceae]QLX15519.1 hypothetical protein HV230_13705 [Klebsiella oxytoca]MCZ3532892.1 hypothetical protein [Klebsiella variicola]UAP51201.1 hypothetical protein J6O57_12080 [Escherichia coli]UAP55582.1 hypothetical protein J6O05_12075 [Escherichia coli]HBR3034507.1 hypothetical protein [Klebsiella pneumoniae]
MAEKEKVFLTNTTQAPIHIGAKNSEGTVITISIAPLKAVEVDGATLTIGGVKQFLDEGRLKEVSAAEAKKLNKEHDGVVESEDE